MKKLFKWLTMCLVIILAMFTFAACTDPDKGGDGGNGGGSGGGSETTMSYSITCDEDDIFGDYYKISADYSKVGAGKTVTVTISDLWDFLTVSKVYANDTECAASSTAGKYTFTMPSENVTVTAEFAINKTPSDDTMTWLDTETWAGDKKIEVGDILNCSFSIDFGEQNVLANMVGGTMDQITVISTNQNVIPNDAMSVSPDGQYAYATEATLSFDTEKVAVGTTTIIFIDRDNDRVITVDVEVVPNDTNAAID